MCIRDRYLDFSREVRYSATVNPDQGPALPSVARSPVTSPRPNSVMRLRPRVPGLTWSVRQISKSAVSQANPNPSSRFREASRYSTFETVLESRFSKILLSTLLEPVSIGSLGAGQVLSAKSCQRLKLMNSTWDQKPFPDLSRTWVRVSLWYITFRYLANRLT